MQTFFKSALVATAVLASVAAGAQTTERTYVPRTSVDTTEIDARIDRQWERIARGIERGQLTRDEARQLRREHREIERMQARAKADGRVSRWEADRLVAMVDRADQHIRDLRRNLDEQG
jgi:predicted XRE-type DNA-binding protein